MELRTTRHRRSLFRMYRVGLAPCALLISCHRYYEPSLRLFKRIRQVSWLDIFVHDGVLDEFLMNGIPDVDVRSL